MYLCNMQTRYGFVKGLGRLHKGFCLQKASWLQQAAKGGFKAFKV